MVLVTALVGLGDPAAALSRLDPLEPSGAASLPAERVLAAGLAAQHVLVPELRVDASGPGASSKAGRSALAYPSVEELGTALKGDDVDWKASKALWELHIRGASCVAGERGWTTRSITRNRRQHRAVSPNAPH